MPFEENLRSLTLEADASVGILTGPPGVPGSATPNYGKQYCFVKLTGTLQCGLATAAGDLVVGVLQNKPQRPGDAATVGYEGVSQIRVAGAVAANKLLAPDATGRGVDDAANGRWLTLAPATTANEVVPCLKVR